MFFEKRKGPFGVSWILDWVYINYPIYNSKYITIIGSKVRIKLTRDAWELWTRSPGEGEVLK